MKFIELYAGEDGKSHFREINVEVETEQPLGSYSKKYPVGLMMFRKFKKGNVFDLHTAPQPQFIIYLQGEVEVETSGGDKRIFKAGDVLLANDLTGEGHITRTLTEGRSIIVTSLQEVEEKHI